MWKQGAKVEAWRILQSHGSVTKSKELSINDPKYLFFAFRKILLSSNGNLTINIIIYLSEYDIRKRYLI